MCWNRPPAHLARSRTNIDAGQRKGERATQTLSSCIANLGGHKSEVGLRGNEAHAAETLRRVVCLPFLPAGLDVRWCDANQW
jgi:hypothetical protein